jgi:import inner membrane translocase subunit TIM23
VCSVRHVCPSSLGRILTGDAALVYNVINSSVDGFRGKHDTLGSMIAGSMTGALYKSTGEPWALVSART